jgi:hypothetical protein
MVWGTEAAMERRTYVWKSVGTICAILALALVPSAGGGDPAHPKQNAAITRSVKTPAIHAWHRHFDELPILFEPNVGQAPAPIEYVARSKGYNVAVTEQGIILGLRQAQSSRNRMVSVTRAEPDAALRQDWLRMSLVGSRAHTPLRAERKPSIVTAMLTWRGARTRVTSPP